MRERASVAMLPPSASWSVDQALDYARREQLDEVIVVGSRGGALTVRSSAMSRDRAHFLLEKARLHALDA